MTLRNVPTHGGHSRWIGQVTLPKVVGLPLWWIPTGFNSSNCLIAYQPKGAADQASSYINLANPGTYNAYAGTVPSWSASKGWTFLDSSNQFLYTGAKVTTQNFSYIVQISEGNPSSAASMSICGCNDAGYGSWYSLWCNYASGGAEYDNGGSYVTAPAFTTGNLAVAGRYGYRNGVVDTTAMANKAQSTEFFTIGHIQRSVGSSYPYKGNVHAFALYSSTLTASEVAEVARNMAMI